MRLFLIYSWATKELILAAQSPTREEVRLLRTILSPKVVIVPFFVSALDERFIRTLLEAGADRVAMLKDLYDGPSREDQIIDPSGSRETKPYCTLSLENLVVTMKDILAG